MTEPRRLLNGAADDFELALLRSARLDEPRERSVLETAAALGVGTALLGATTATSAAAAGSGAAATGAVAAGAAKLTASVLFKYFSVGLAAGLLTVGAFQLSGPSETAPSSALPAAVTPPAVAAPSAPPAAAPKAAVARAEVERVDPAAARSPLPPRGPRPSSQPVVSAERSAPAPTLDEAPLAPQAVAAFELPVEPAPPAAKKPVEAAPSILAEVAVLDRARRALAARQGAAALSILNEYDAAPSRVLQTEASVLRIEALLQTGQREQAVLLARQLIAAQPGSRHAARLRGLLGER